jgi:autotransporter family porin
VRFTSVETFNSATPEVAEMTALNVELTLLTRRACFEGYFEWLNDVEGRGDYAAGDQWGCMGAWFAGRWYTDDASYYIDRVRNELENEQSWLSSDF